MSANKFIQPFSFKIKQSKNKLLLLLLPHLFIAMVLCLLFGFKYLQISYLLIALIVILASLVYFVRLHLTLSSSKSVYAVQRKINDSWSLIFKNKIKENVFISDFSFASNSLIILNFIDQSKNNYYVLITLDSVAEEVFRRLKVLIKTRKTKV